MNVCSNVIGLVFVVVVVVSVVSVFIMLWLFSSG